MRLSASRPRGPTPFASPCAVSRIAPTSPVVAPVVIRGWSEGPSPGRHVHGRVVRGARGGARRVVGAPGTGRAGESSGALRVAGFSGPARSRGEKRVGSIPVVADPRRRRPARGAAPLRLGSALPLTPQPGAFTVRGRIGADERCSSVRTMDPNGDSTLSPPIPPGRLTTDGPPGRDRRWSCSSRSLLRVPAAASSRPSVLEPAPLFAERVLRTASRSHGVSGWGCLLPVLVEIHQLVLRGRARRSCGRAGRAVQGPGVGQRPSPGRHVHGRVVRGARGGGSSGLRAAPWTGWAGGSSIALEGGGVVGACPVTWRETGAGQSQSLRILGESVRPGGPHSLRLGWDCPKPDGPPGRDGRWSRSSLGLAPRPGGCVLSA